MKCIKSIKSTKNIEVGTIKRINDKEADSEVKGGYWKYIPKSEWKKGYTTENQPTEVIDNESIKTKKSKKVVK
jgi:hypothetical protein